MADKPISELTGATGVNLTDLFLLSQGSSSLGFDSKKLVASDLAVWLANQVEFTQQLSYTTAKTLIGAINEIAQSGGGGGGGATIYVSTSAPSSVTGSNGDLYVQYTHDSGTDTDSVDALYVKINGTWDEISTGGSGGVSDLDDLSDVDISSPSAGQVLTYDATTSKWKNANAGAGSSDVFVIHGTSSGVTETAADILDAIASNKTMLFRPYTITSSQEIWICERADYYLDNDIPSTGSLSFVSVDFSREFSVSMKSISLSLHRTNGVIVGDPYNYDLGVSKAETMTLTAGATSLTFSGLDFPSSAFLDVYTSIYGVNPSAITPTITSGRITSVTMTFEAQAANMTVCLKASEPYI